MIYQLIALSTLVSTAWGDIRGVSPENSHLYQPIVENGKQYWHCLNDTSIKLSFDQINDNFCDCPDGSDEPGTNACPKPLHKFYCGNEGHFPNYIDQFKVDDGVCDYDICCDGSDEPEGVCENKCEEIHRQYEEYKNNVEKSLEKALQKKQSIIKLAQSRRQQLINELRKLESSLPPKKMELNKLQIELETKNDGIDDLSVFDVLGDHISDLASKLESHKRDIINQEQKIQSLEVLLEKLSKEYNPNFNDPAVKESIHKYQEYISNKDSEIRQDIHETNQVLKDLAETAKSLSHNENNIYIQPSIGNMVHHYFKKFTGTFLTKPELQVVSNLSNDELENKINQLVKDIEKLEVTIEAIKNNLNTDLGPNDLLRAFDSKTITKKLGGYNYLINILGTVSQDDVLIGNFKEYKDGKAYYTNGAKCWNGPKRSAVIEFECGEGLELKRNLFII
ncbi:hypothetical protein G210_0396 [Candida maltosa Xu316]|uniref:Glucosidase 2 subunit beta n=1 Tax=Candida maltosa (strain Xu316) TaxID=1245528 RepID=M3K0X0_CANMX|nr:hypothetical protein G210_0396 [Candida maltosa Xu316]